MITRSPCPKCKSKRFVFLTCTELGGEGECRWFGKCLDCGHQSSPTPDLSKARGRWFRGQ